MAVRAKIDGKTLSLKCPCGYVKHDVMHLGVKKGQWKGSNKPLNYCGGLFLVSETGNNGYCKLCGFCTSSVDFNCAFCGKETRIPVNYREAATSGRVTILQMSVHKTVIFC